MTTLHLEEALTDPSGHEGDVLACAYMPDNTCLISAGWDGMVRFWDTGQGVSVDSFGVSDKPISACALSADGQLLLTGTMDGLLARWDTGARFQHSLFLAHTRPISDLVFSPDGRYFASASWDRSVYLWETEQRQEGISLGCHEDIVAGCRFTPDGRRLISWSYDGTSVVWDLSMREPIAQLIGHTDRLTAGAISPDGLWFVSGTRNGEVKLWEMNYGQEAASVTFDAEIRSCFFLLDLETIILVEATGRLLVCQLPELQLISELNTGKSIQKAVLAPSGGQIALGDANGLVSFVTVEGFDNSPLAVTAIPDFRTSATMFQRLLRQSRIVVVFQCTCPACRALVEIPEHQRTQATVCPQCRRPLRICAIAEPMEMAEMAGRE